MIDAIHDQHARVAWDIPEIRPHTWAIQGATALDGEVILAEFDSRDAARAVLDSLGATERGVDTDACD